MAAQYDYQIGTTLGGMVNVETLTGGLAPRGVFRPYSKDLQLGSGLVRGGGWANATWTWDVISQAQRDALRAYCPGRSAVVYVKTRTMDSADAYHVYQAVLVWPIKEEERSATRRLNLVLTFQRMVFVS